MVSSTKWLGACVKNVNTRSSIADGGRKETVKSSALKKQDRIVEFAPRILRRLQNDRRMKLLIDARAARVEEVSTEINLACRDTEKEIG